MLRRLPEKALPNKLPNGWLCLPAGESGHFSEMNDSTRLISDQQRFVQNLAIRKILDFRCLTVDFTFLRTGTGEPLPFLS